MTSARLKARTVKELASMARRKGVPGWHAMRKEELIQALVKLGRSSASPASKRNGANGQGSPPHGGKKGSKASNGNGRATGTGKSRSGQVVRRLDQIKAKLALSKDLSMLSAKDGKFDARDRLVAMVRDPYWLHVTWELTRGSIERARAALGQHWYGARAVLRVVEVARNGTTSSVRRVVRDIEIHGGVNNWYVDVDEPPRSFQMEIGYLALGGRFIALARSNVVTTPAVGTVKAVDGNWAGVAEDFDRIYAMSGGYTEDGSHSELKDLFEERLRRPMGSSPVGRYGLGATGAVSADGRRDFCFQVDAELVVFGVTDPDAQVTLRGEPVRLQPDGSFRMRFNLPDRRHVLPVVASSADGVQQRTIVLAVERNTKVMEPVIREPGA